MEDAAPHGGGAFSGKDPTKVDRSAAYAARYIAKNVVASKITDKCLIQLAYAIGVSKPLSIYVDLFDNDLDKNQFVIDKINENFDLSPRGIREMLSLNKPIYEKTAAYGHFGRMPEENGSFSWEKIDKTSHFFLIVSIELNFFFTILLLHYWIYKMGTSPFFFRVIKNMLNKRADKLELLRIAEAVALEKSIDKELIISSMETGIAKAAKSKFGQENEIKVLINRDNGDIEIFRKLIVAENPENSNTEIKLEDAINLNEINKDKAIGDEVLQPLPSFDFGRIAAQTAKQVISFNVREAERERQYNDFIDKKDSILSGIVKRLEFGNVIADLGRTEAIIQKNEMIPRENIKAGDRIKAYCYDVRREPRGQQIFLSRAHPKFMEKLFAQEVPEIYDGLIEIKSSSRDPGSRAKICVKAVDTSLDPVGACVGMRGSRVQAVVNELQGEKIDIVNWSEDPAILVSNALSPAEVQRVNVDYRKKKIRCNS